MKILMLIDSLGKGGKERRMLEFIKGLKSMYPDTDIYLISLTDLVQYDSVYELPIRFEILKRRYKKDFTVVFKLRKIIKSFRPDIIHSWSTMASVYISIANLFNRIPFINGVLADAYPKLNLLEKHYLRVKLTTPFTDAFVSNSRAGIRAYKTPVQKSVCIYNGMNFDRFENLKPVEEMEYELLSARKEDRFIAAMVAVFDLRKDYETLVNVAVSLCSRCPKVIFLLIGGGPTLPAIRGKVPLTLLNKQIFFTGRRDDIESIIQIIDVGILITNAAVHGEGISNSIIEYMALGKPVIATRGGGTDELVKDGFNGFLINPKNENEIIEKLELLMNDKGLRELLGQNAYQWSREQFSVEDKTKEYINLYRKLMKQ